MAKLSVPIGTQQLCSNVQPRPPDVGAGGVVLAKGSHKVVMEAASLNNLNWTEGDVNAVFATLHRIENKLDPSHVDYINKDIEAKLNPIAENYEAAAKLGKWIMALLLALSLISGSIWAIVQTLHTSK